MPSSCALLALALLASIAPSALFAQEDAVGNRVLEEVLVTAQKREQRITDVPMSITVLSGEFMSDAGIEDSAQLAAYIPGMTFSDTATGTPVFTLRGVGFNEYSPQTDPGFWQLRQRRADG